MSAIKFISTVLATFTVIALFVIFSDSEALKAEPQAAKAEPFVLDVYKSPTCGCCKKWITHVNDNGFESNAYNRNDLTQLKEDKGIAPRYRSCHTAISKEGYVFEGHVPAKHIQQFLAEKHEDALGLSAPGMGMGSPGMEMGDKFTPYKVLLLKTDGTSEVYASINSYKEQF